MKDKDYFSHLYEIASHLNKEHALGAALRKALAKTVEILELETGWFWLTEQNNKSVYLAASYNLPPALRKHPERLSGWCYCIKQYLSDDIEQATNISEIACSRLENIVSGTKDLKFHATIPIIINNQKVGLMNLLSKESRQLDEKELTILNTISELIGIAIQRTRLQQSYGRQNRESSTAIQSVLKRIFIPQMEALIACLDDPKEKNDNTKEALTKAINIQQQFLLFLGEAEKHERTDTSINEFQYPERPLTKRELEVLTLIKEGRTNDQIGKQLFIAERTVKFHVTAILSKLNADNRTEAVNISLKRGLLSI